MSSGLPAIRVACGVPRLYCVPYPKLMLSALWPLFVLVPFVLIFLLLVCHQCHIHPCCVHYFAVHVSVSAFFYHSYLHTDLFLFTLSSALGLQGGLVLTYLLML